MPSDLTRAARGQECTLQFHPYCNNDPSTVVFCHAPSEDKGWAIKSPDWWGADGCSVCHDIVDGRKKTSMTSEEINEGWLRGIYMTIRRRIRQGVIKV